MDWNWRGLRMRDIKRAERLLSLFTSPDSAAGIVGDLSEEQGQRGRVWFWRQVLHTTLSLCRGTLFASPVVVLLLVALGLTLLVVSALGVSVATRYMFASPHLDGTFAMSLALSIPRLRGWSGALLAGATLVAIAPRLGMVACVVLAGVHSMLLLALVQSVLAAGYQFWWPRWIPELATPAFPLLGGALIRLRQIRKLLRTA
jgi:hypothetical protein